MRFAPALVLGFVAGVVGCATFVRGGGAEGKFPPLAGDEPNGSVRFEPTAIGPGPDMLAVAPWAHPAPVCDSTTGPASDDRPESTPANAVAADVVALGLERRTYVLHEGYVPMMDQLGRAPETFPFERSVREIGKSLHPGRTCLEGTAAHLDAWEAWFDRWTFAGGRDQTIEFIYIADSAACLDRCGVIKPAEGTTIPIAGGGAETIARWVGAGSHRLVVDVPEDRGIVGFIGDSYAYLADYDIEISMGAYISAPIYRTFEAGLRVSATLDDSDGGVPRLRLEAQWNAGPPEFESFTTPFGDPTGELVAYEVPKAARPAARFVGVLPIANGEGSLIGMSHDGVLLVVPRGPIRAATRLRAWTRIDPDAEGLEVAARPSRPETVEVAWTRTDGGGGDTRGSARFEHIGESATDLQSATIDAIGTIGDGLAELAAPGSAHVATGLAIASRRIDVVVCPTRALDPASRTFPLYQSKVPAVLPRVSRAVISLRVLLRMGETAVRDVTLDRGDGSESWRVTVTRRPDAEK